MSCNHPNRIPVLGIGNPLNAKVIIVYLLRRCPTYLYILVIYTLGLQVKQINRQWLGIILCAI